MKVPEDNLTSFVNECDERIENEIDNLIYYGVSKKNMKPARSPRLGMCVVLTLYPISAK